MLLSAAGHSSHHGTVPSRHSLNAAKRLTSVMHDLLVIIFFPFQGGREAGAKPSPLNTPLHRTPVFRELGLGT